jgi:uncharacterized protein
MKKKVRLDNNYRPEVRVGRASAGLGLFAEEDIPKGQMIIEYKGERISSEEADRRGGLYLFDVTKKIVIDGKSRKNTARYINHGCKPNAEAEPKKKEGRMFIRAIKTIKKGEEIAYNYGKNYMGDMIKEGKCRCKTCLKK